MMQTLFTNQFNLISSKIPHTSGDASEDFSYCYISAIVFGNVKWIL